MTNRKLLWLAGSLLMCIGQAAHAVTNVFTCEPEWAALVDEIGGELVKTGSATTGLQDVHHIEARPSLIARVRQADLLLCTGAGLEEGWLPVLQRRANNPRVQVGAQGYMELANHVRLLDRPARVDRSEGDVHAQGNPHIQLDPRNIPVIAQAVAERLSVIDPEHAKAYQENLSGFLSRWKTALAGWQEQAQPLQGMPVVVHHNSWIYLINWLELDLVGTLEPKPGLPPTSVHLSQLLEQLEQQPAQVIIRSPYQGARSSEWLAERTGVPDIMLPSTVGGNEAATDLFSLFDNIVQQLLSARQ
jgi:zinc/manganese transport system substrate-binding protein